MYEAEARAWVQTLLPGVDISPLTDETIHDYLVTHHPDGWGGFCYAQEQREHEKAGHFGREVALNRELPDTPLRQWARISQRFHLRKGVLDEVMMMREEPNEIVVVLKVFETLERGRRLKVERQGIRIMCWKRKPDSGYWKRQEDLESWFDQPEFDSLHIWGRIRDMERVASDEWQLSECYRPGTAASPMDGAVRRLEMSHKDMFGKVTRPS